MPGDADAHNEHLIGELIRNLKRTFYGNSDIIALIDTIDSFHGWLQHALLLLCLALSTASPSLLPGTLKRVQRAALFLDPDELERWIGSALTLLNTRGLEHFIGFIKNIAEENLRGYRRPERLRLKEVADTLEIYLRGISGRELSIATDSEPYTDTATVYLLPVLSRFKGRRENFLVYKLMTAHKWAQIALGTLTPDLKGVLPDEFLRREREGHSHSPTLEILFLFFPERELAVDLFTLLEAFMLDSFLWKELPGLMEKAAFLKEEIFRERPVLEGLSEKTAFVEGIYHYYLAGCTRGAASPALQKIRDSLLLLREKDDPKDLVKILLTVYAAAVTLGGGYLPHRPAFFLGTVKPERVSRKLRARSNEVKRKTGEALQKNLALPGNEGRPLPVPSRPVPPRNDTLPGSLPLEKEREDGEASPWEIRVRGNALGGGGISFMESDSGNEERGRTQGGGISYDEWDYQKGEYRKQWCCLYEQEVSPSEDPFVQRTRDRYRGYVSLVRKQFELLRTEHALRKRQKDGDAVDFDAAVEAFVDARAGLAPSENLFTRVEREKRNIAVLFLIDMSGSTKGWVNEAEKESLVIMCEALTALDDRYAIYGFSGVTRTKCEYYRIKTFEESYSDRVKGRIAGITPKDYTRMGAPLRHSTNLLKPVEALTKFLITLSDGRPEDLGAYKGDYAIEDTRRALIEAKRTGIHPFCITIDTEADSYLPHMYGEVNYVVIDNVRKLPGRIAGIYRRLTA